MSLSHRRTLLALGLGCLVVITLSMTLGARGSWSFVLPFRATKLFVICLVAHAVGVSTVLFQTLSGNRILTPAVMGFDALFLMLQTALFLLLGSFQVTSLPGWAIFVLQVAAMGSFAALLYRRLFTGSAQSLHMMILVGIVLGTLFRSLANYLQSLIDPNEFLVLQGRLFANFNNADPSALGISALVIAASTTAVILRLPRFDVIGLGRERAINLGLDYRREMTFGLALIGVLVSVSAALVGPVTFFGLLVAHLAYRLLPTHRHAVVLPAVSMIAIMALLIGQFVLERVFSFGAALSMVIEFGGGILFLFLLLRGAAR
ncbi:MAG: enterobactin ABC transporter permease [Candidatus Dactylopiibacterium carminicum]|nr:MAG: enterobactin ABC transporter permease [Candidatus Dactylopiibacterium carminicum]